MLTTQNLSASIAGISVLRGISTSWPKGACVAVVGRNGAGKTTLLRVLMGLVPATAGQVLLDNKIQLLQTPARERVRQGIGYAPEERVMFPSFSVQENLRFPCEVLGLPKAEVNARLEQTLTIVPELRPMLERSGAALSGGQGKMAALGRAIMAGSRLVLLDEPFQGLAPALAQQYSASLQRLLGARPELTVVVTESNRSLLGDIAQMTLTLERGALVQAR